ncbi:tryptophan-rich sensory protein [Propionicicella superfundia]|uniref:tryptophan-rich sensory protein n=1 Tax=Propionicicella superfundia TaxID=348582 RepID=UPI00041CF43F|nr:tryptophan-rich sensory protein [Propionicicella superfundia]
MTQEEPATTPDRARQVAVIVTAVLMLLAALAGVGVIGTSVPDSAGGVFAAGRTLLTPGGPAFAVWSVIYLGLIAFAVRHTLTPADPRARRIGWPAAVSMLLNGAWLLVVQFGWVWMSVLVITLLVVDLAVLVGRLAAIPASSPSSSVILDGTFGLYLGWVSVATVANIAVAVSATVSTPGEVSELLAVAVLIVAVALAGRYANKLGARWAVAGGMAWAFAWIAVARLTGTPRSVIVGTAAGAAAATVLVLTALRRLAAAGWSLRSLTRRMTPASDRTRPKTRS